LPVTYDGDFKTITQGGGPFVNLLAQAGRVLTVLSIASQFMIKALQIGNKHIVPTKGQFPFEAMAETEIEKVQFKVDKFIREKRAKLQFLLQGENELQPNAFNALICNYFKFLVATSKKCANEDDDEQIDEEEMKALEEDFKNLSLGDVIAKAVDCLLYIFEAKVFSQTFF
jgi:hypothetical protein